MTYSTIGHLQPGDKLEFWARKTMDSLTPYVVLQAGDEMEFQVADLPDYFEFFRYTNHTGKVLAIDVEPKQIEFGFIYTWSPASLAHQGIQVLTTETSSKNAEAFDIGPERPQLHFSPLKQWMNDPNGLCYVNGEYHLFYQFHPNSAQWGPMHWGHAVSRDLFNWVHYPVFLHPEQNLLALGATGGAFSGTACRDEQGQLMFFYTERLPAYDLYEGYVEIQKRALPNAHLTAPECIQTMITDRPDGIGCDFRDPKVWYDPTAACYYMILGAALNGDPAVLLYASKDTLEWTYQRPLYVAPPYFRENGARCIECPDFFEVDGRWVLYVGFVGFHDPDTCRHNLMYYLVGDFTAKGHFIPKGGLCEVDFGTDYYAMQSFEANDRRLALAWLYNWEFSKPKGSAYSGEMSLPRQLSISSTGELRMHPIISGLRSSTLPLSSLAPLTFAPGGQPFLLRVNAGGSNLSQLHVRATDASRNTFEVAYEDNQIRVVMPEDDGSIHYISRQAPFRDMMLLFDGGILELFLNDGAICGTRRSYIIESVAKVTVDLGGLQEDVEISMEALSKSSNQ